ncbi:MAG: hypothetical protein R3Y36_04445 [Spirochaetales bacterium]
MKYKLLFLSFLLLLSSCTSTIPNIIMTYTGEGSLRYYIRQETVKKGNVDSMFDFAVVFDDDTVTQDIVVNYTLSVKNFSLSETEKVAIDFIGDGNVYPLTFVDVIFKDPQKAQVRITAMLTADQFVDLVSNNSQTVEVRFTHPDMETLTVRSKGLEEKFEEFRILL